MSIEVTGLKEFQVKLKTLPDKVAKRFMGIALKEGCKEIAGAIASAAPVKNGQLVASIEVKSGQSQGQIYGLVKAAFYARFLEKGTEGRLAGGGRKSRSKDFIQKWFQKVQSGGLVGAIKPTYFMSKAVESSIEDCVDKAAEKLGELIENELSD